MNYEDLKKNHPEFFSNQKAAIEIITDEKVIQDWQSDYREKLSKQGKPTDWALIGVVYEDPYSILVRDLVKFPDGALGTHIRSYSPKTLNGCQAVAVLPILEGKVLLLHHFRHATRNWHYELPRGYGDANITAEQNARKELKEETSWDTTNLFPLGELHENTGIDGMPIQLFLARLEESQRPAVEMPEIAEGIESLEFVSIEDFERMIRDETITDGYTLAAYARAKLRGYL